MTHDASDFRFRLYQLLHGGALLDPPLKVGEIPTEVSIKLGWTARSVYVSNKDAQKIRHHPQHGMDATRGQQLPLVIEFGDYYQTQNRGSSRQIEIVLHEPDRPKRAYFLVLARNEEDTGIFLRTFYFTAELSRNKMKKAVMLRDQSNLGYFK